MPDKPNENRAAWLRGVIEAATAAVEGRAVQRRLNSNGEWVDSEARWFNDDVMYRAKPQPKYRPFTAVELMEFCPRVVVGAGVAANDTCLAAGVRRGGNVLMIRQGLHFELDAGQLLSRFVTEDDGTPCGIRLEGE